MLSLESRIPPPVVAMSCAGAMWLVAGRCPQVAIGQSARVGIAGVLALAGVVIATSAIAAFRRARTTVNPMKPDAATALVTTGIYQHTRNPMYVGLCLLLSGWAAFLRSPVALIGVAAFGLYIDRFQIVPEERALARLFGDTYTDYTARVRRWL